MRNSLIIGAVLVLAAVVLAVLHLWGAATLTGVLGIVIALAVVFRRFGRAGDFSRSGWTGQ
ncbi:hypothetical protein BIU98_04390 [Curtobacterium sp. MMLR14_010]|uniref:hypothetical protein n=1 Tax=Curtobacterium sp. MMLR14_010 TaxID=1898743 RepID=UPI0008DDA160|nr:hypothetical protein [Curtobacterium sp. MMLR14_010]OII35166.1 hypothetical protein BIU98_04390 [Curtobacterium sp. MMLR14_010]